MNEPDEGRRRSLAVFRHSLTKKGEGRGQGSHLSSEGVALAQRVGAESGPFDRVYVSPSPRTMETALAMGFAVDAVIEFSCGYVSGEFEHHDQWGWEQPYVRFAELLHSGGRLSQLAAADAELWTRRLMEVPAGGRVLIVSHGGSIEPVLVACLPDAEHTTWGQPFSHCDGVILTFEGGRFVAADFKRALSFG
jgi:broad specificity phosphatase PhoE